MDSITNWQSETQSKVPTVALAKKKPTRSKGADDQMSEDSEYSQIQKY